MRALKRHALRSTQYVMTHDEIAAVLGISRAAVWQHEQKALRKIARRPHVLAQFKALIELRQSLRGDNVLRLSRRVGGGV